LQFGLCARPVTREMLSTAVRAGSSLRLKTGCAQDDTLVRKTKLHHNLGKNRIA